MTRWIQTLTCVSVLSIASSAFGWGGSRALTLKETPNPASNFPLNANQQWFVEESYLIMKPYEDDNDYATRLKTEGSLTSSLSMTMTLKKPDFDWSSGLRIGIGRYLANHDKWDLSLYTTYFYANEDASSYPKRSNNTLLTPLWSPTFDGGATKGRLNWRLNFFNWDLSLGREYRMLSTIVAHPFIGLRTALIYKDYKAHYTDSFLPLDDQFKAADRFWGVGPRAGVNLQFNFKNGWSFMGNLSGAIFYGHYNVSEKISTNVVTANTPTLNQYRLSDERYCIRANLDTGLGLGWETWLNRRSVRLAPSALIEASCWFDTNKFFLAKTSSLSVISPTPLVPNFSNTRRRGNLILMGFSFNLQADF